MAVNVRDKTSQLVAQFSVPFKGTWRGVAANMVTPDSLYSSLNVYIREGKIKERPGLTLLNPTEFDNPVIGGKLAVTPLEKVLLAFTKSSLYTLRDMQTSWQVDTVTPLASDVQSRIDITFIETTGEYIGIIANGETPLKKWTSSAGITDITASIGTVPVARSVCTTTSRIVALVSPHTVRWTGIFDINNWSDLNYNKIARTNDKGICVRDLGTKAFVLYKERSIYLGTPRAGSDASAFATELVQEVEGPAGLHAVVNADGVHYFMTSSGRIGMFDGTSYVQWIADGLWFYLQTDVDPEEAYQIFGIYDYRWHTVTFYYPRDGDNGDVMGCVIVNLPLQGSGIDSHAAFLGDLVKPVTYAIEKRFDNRLNETVLFTNTITNKRSFRWDDTGKKDDDIEFNCHIQTGLQPMPQMQYHHVTTEPFLERHNAFGFVNLFIVTSDALENKTGSFDTTDYHIINLNLDLKEEYFGFNRQTRFAGLRLEWPSSSTVKYGGALLYGKAMQ